MKYISQHTDIPLPCILDEWTLANGQYAIWMEWISGGRTLKEAWPSMSFTERDSICSQVRGFVDQLRQLEQPPAEYGHIGPIDGELCWDPRIMQQPCGPFELEEIFNRFRISRINLFRGDETTNGQTTCLEVSLSSDYHIVFTHGDLNFRNMLVDENCNVIGILDWEMSGWMPEHWEYLKGYDGNWQEADWELYASRFVPSYKKEIDVENEFIIINGNPLL